VSTTASRDGVREESRGALALQLLGVGLFLVIPLVLFLFVRHPRPVGASLGAGVLLMLAHRFVARPYMERARQRKCLWCNRGLATGAPVRLGSGSGTIEAIACAAHVAPARRFFVWLARVGPWLRVGIFVPLLALLAALTAAALGHERALATAVPLFQLVVGMTVNVAAIGYLATRPIAADLVPRVPFPAHNFFLLGVRNLLWIFRLVGIWWIVRGALDLLAFAR
jgi:hypothetical protein